MTPLKTLSTGIAAIALAAGLAAATPAAADPGAVIAGVIGGAAVGAIIAGTANQPYYDSPAAGYYAPAPVYRAAPVYEPAPAYYDDDDAQAYRPRCHIVREPLRDDWGRLAGYQRVRVCR